VRRAPNQPARRPTAAANANDDDDDDDDEDLPDLPGARPASTRRAEPEAEEDEEEEEAEAEAEDEDDDNQDADASADPVPSGDRGYQRKDNSKMNALLEQKRARQAVEDDEEDE
jgi:hypothetical protein